jgi:hypothetical protein
MSTTEDFVDLFVRGARAGTDLLGSFASSRVVKDLSSRMRSCSCAIPPPCWLPKAVGSVRSDVCAGGTATVRLLVENCGPTERAFTIEAAGADAKEVTLSPASATLEPMDCRVVAASLSAPAQPGERREALLWVHGCHDHYLRWTVNTARRACDSCHEVEVKDCPDYVHHWYDHFYCDRPCPGSKAR